MTEHEPRGPEVFTTDVNGAAVTERSPQMVETPLGKLALVRDGERIVAIDAWCPHLDGPLWEGSSAGGEIACPWHRWRYSLATGRCTWAPKGDEEEAAETSIDVHATALDPQGRVQLLLGGRPG
ncbi:Rieske (2Fe-2S) protein [bacterium]|nr:Rieske (2Fe-2S) protein [bacterium]